MKIKLNFRFKFKRWSIAPFILLIIASSFIFSQSVRATGAADSLAVGEAAGASASLAAVAASLPVTNAADIPRTLSQIVAAIIQKLEDSFNTFATQAYNVTLRNTLNRLAMDGATWLASGGNGQKPQYVVEGEGTYIQNLGDAAAGDMIDSLSKSWGVNLCQPADPMVRVNIGLGLVEEQAPQKPNCTLTSLITNWDTSVTSQADRLTAFKNGSYVSALREMFKPGGSDISVAATLFDQTNNAKATAADNAKLSLKVNQGWIDKTDIAGNLLGIRGNTKQTAENINSQKNQSFFSQTGNILVDTANIFLNQLAYEAYQRGMQSLTKSTKSTSAPYDFSSLKNSISGNSAYTSLIQYGETIVSEKLSSLVTANFDVKSDYNSLATLSSCVDLSNPSPDTCALDDRMSEAISEKKTVAEALVAGNLHSDWLMTADNKANNAYTLRNIQILIKYRIIPVGWEQAITVAASKGLKVTLSDMISCFAPDDEFNTYSSGFDQSNQTWCRGLIDPHWVLKAPLDKCAKEGVGSQILTSAIVPNSSGSNYLSITRADNYCADQQTCIKEEANGSCDVYGYCNQEKRTWNFGNTSECKPINNTCQTFTNTNTNQTVSYLQNTLNYGTCNAQNVGCQQYSYNGVYNTSTATVAWNKNYSLNLNGQTPTCAATNESCTGLYRVEPSWGNNLIMDSDFSLESVGSSTSNGLTWPINGTASIIDGSTVGLDRGKILDVSASSSVYSNSDHSLLPENMSVIPGWSYTLSADIYVVSPTGAVTVSLGDNNTSTTTTSNDSWDHVALTINGATTVSNTIDFSFSGGGSEFYLRNAKLEINNQDSGYTLYGAFEAYEKIIPAYLENICYVNAGNSGTKDYQLKPDAPAICSNFARKCNKDEVGCQLFTSVIDTSFSIPAQVATKDYCDAKCVGYNTYVAQPTYFFNSSADNLIPSTAQTCTLAAAGCSSFTNLDASTAGGEQQEYYTYIRQCIKPTDVNARCADYYNWQGDATAGYQLKTISLQSASSSKDIQTINNDSAQCNAAIFSLSVADPRYNPNCQQFYDKFGNVYYHLADNTITCSDNCHAYRLNNKNIDQTITSAAKCTGSDKNWDASQGACDVCLSGGVWSATNQACIYNAIPNEGMACKASESGCREYTGNDGANIQILKTFDFENGISDWSGPVASSLVSNSKNGHSLLYTPSGEALTSLAGSIQAGQSYVLRFVAKAAVPNDINLNFYLKNSAGEMTYFNVSTVNSNQSIIINGDDNWHVYEVNTNVAIASSTNGEVLAFSADNSFFIDNLTLTAVTDHYYLIKGSSQIPDVCSYDMMDNYQGPNYNLGCAQYTDSNQTTNNLHSFSSLCQDSAVGCELMINTKNSSAPEGQKINGNVVSPHEAIYAVYDESKLCTSDNAGCSRVGYQQAGSASVVWTDVYKKIVPDNYGTTSCQASEVGCEAWTDNNKNTTYFKNPGPDVCEYRAPHQAGQSGDAWFEITKRCDVNGDGKISVNEVSSTPCVYDGDCAAGVKCIQDISNDHPCSVSYLKTIGYGGPGNQVPVPNTKVGLCSAIAAGCSEYVDPVSTYSVNLVNNSILETNTNNVIEGWTSNSNGTYSQIITTVPNKLYIFSVSYGVATTTVTATSPLLILDQTNNFSTNTVTLNLGAASGEKVIVFNSGVNTRLTLTRVANVSGATNKADTQIREAIVSYELAQNLDVTSCNGNVNNDNGCVLFNGRTQNGSSGLTALIFNSAATLANQPAKSCSISTATCSPDSNQVIKVNPDRVCSRWIDCRTYGFDSAGNKICYALGECNQLNDKNECSNFLNVSGANVFSQADDKNSTGYSLLGDLYLGAMHEVGVNTDAHYNFEGTGVNLACRQDVDNPSGLDSSDKPIPCSYNNSLQGDFLVTGPDGAPTDYPAQGRAYLKILDHYQISPLAQNATIPIQGGQDYYINYLVNTKNSDAHAKVLIVEASTTSNKYIVDKRFFDSSNNGWTRVVHKFNLSSGAHNVSIFLSSDSQEDKYVYFDDINIEPVLQVGNATSTTANNYIAKDCRLYPDTSSLTCTSANNNVIKDGIYGYCLQYDQNNPSVCMMWYPIDKISAIYNTNSNVLGYKGQFPLYYCNAVNGKFQMYKKIEMRKVFDGYWCEGDPNKIISTGTEASSTFYCGSFKDYTYVQVSSHNRNYWNPSECSGDLDKYEHVSGYCIPHQTSDTIPIGTETVLYQDPVTPTTYSYYQQLWAPFNNNFKKVSIHEDLRNGQTANCTNQLEPCQAIDEINNDKPVIAITDATAPTLSNLQYLQTYTGNGTDVYRLTCSSFSQFIDSSGAGQPWTDRISRNSAFLDATPDYFYGHNSNPVTDYTSSLINYGRNREDIPFGAAVISSNLDLTKTIAPVDFRNQYSQGLGEINFAGRPYGCSTTNDDSDSGCSHIGQCSGNSSVYCIYFPSEENTTGVDVSPLNNATCGGGGYGSCVPLWKTPLKEADSQNVLNNIFVNQQGHFDHVSSSTTYYSQSLNIFNWVRSNPVEECNNNIRPAGSNSFCYVRPTISNITLDGTSSPNSITFINGGLHKLSFNSLVDKEQEPLRQILINWGDGNIQSISGEDDHPTVGQPDSFYHYYIGSTTPPQVSITIYDNWGKYFSCSIANCH